MVGAHSRRHFRRDRRHRSADRHKHARRVDRAADGDGARRDALCRLAGCALHAAARCHRAVALDRWRAHVVGRGARERGAGGDGLHPANPRARRRHHRRHLLRCAPTLPIPPRSSPTSGSRARRRRRTGARRACPRPSTCEAPFAGGLFLGDYTGLASVGIDLRRALCEDHRRTSTNRNDIYAARIAPSASFDAKRAYQRPRWRPPGAPSPMRHSGRCVEREAPQTRGRSRRATT